MSGLPPITAMAPQQVSSLFPTDLVPEARSGVQNAPGPSSFSQMVSNGIEDVNQKLLTSQTDLQRLATGDVQNLHQVMIQLEESRLSFQLMMQVRSRLLEAYQDVMKMQI
jgi:flagellar hook-basal body complex protein FliE